MTTDEYVTSQKQTQTAMYEYVEYSLIMSVERGIGRKMTRVDSHEYKIKD